MNDVARWAGSSEGALLAWPLLVVAAVALVLVVALSKGPRFFRGTRSVVESFWCPFTTQDVHVDFEIDAWDGHPVDVNRCSAFTPPTAVTCDKRCMSRSRPA